MNARIPALAAIMAMVATASFAQQPMTFRLAAAERNPMSCSQADASMSRPQTVAIAQGVALLTSNGGINDKARLVSPGVYRTRWSSGGITYDIEVNTTTSPATLLVSEPKLGCKWSGKAS